MEQTTQNAPLAPLADTPAEVLYQPESTLPTVTSVADIDHFRVVTKSGESYRATPVQVAELVPYVGENLLFGTTSYNESAIIKFADTDMNVAGYCLISNYLIVGNTYIVHIGNYTGCTPIGCVLYNDNPMDNLILDLSKPFTIDKHYSYFRIITSEEAGIATINEMKLERGSRATPYTPNPADIARAMDYSILTEQIVPGEYLIGADGVKKQVYSKTVRITSDGSFIEGVEIAAGINGVREILSIYGSILIGDNNWPITDFAAIYIRGDAYGGSTRLISKSVACAGKTLVLTLKYTKR